MKSTKQHAFRFLAVCAIALSCTFATTVAAEPSRDGQTDPSSASTQIVQVSEILLGPYSPRAISTWKLRLSKEFEIGIEKIIDWLDPAKGNQITEQPDPVDLKTPEDRSVDPPLTAGSDS